MEVSKLFKTNDDERYKNSSTQTSLVTVITYHLIKSSCDHLASDIHSSRHREDI